ncbi:MAG TPA: alpha/beta hydrolase fold domain-containing protein [Acidobacteriaceae bacterium]|nr:alpha/beta hydrolase fold domain-containing protein [Acidobacteriaceae bacterium]
MKLLWRQRGLACVACALSGLSAWTAWGQNATTPAATTSATAVSYNSSYIEPNGTAHVGRIMPVPQSLSPEAQATLRRPETDSDVPMPLEKRRAMTDAYAARSEKQWQKLCPVTIANDTMAGVPVRRITRMTVPTANADKVLLDLHGGGFDSDSGSYTETIPIAYYAQVPVVAALYRLAPEHPFPAAVDDAVAVYRELLKTHKPEQIAIYGTSAGAILTGEVAVRLKQLSLPEPAALGIFSGFGDFARPGDSIHLYGLRGFSGYLAMPHAERTLSPYVGRTDMKDPVLSPIYADLKGMPPALFVTSGRDLLLSGTTDLHRAFLRAGDDARLMVFDGLPHAFWYNPELPESIEANQAMAKFLGEHLK